MLFCYQKAVRLVTRFTNESEHCSSTSRFRKNKTKKQTREKKVNKVEKLHNTAEIREEVIKSKNTEHKIISGKNQSKINKSVQKSN